MRRKSDPESDKHRGDRLDRNSQERRERGAAEDKALDAAVRRSIQQFGA